MYEFARNDRCYMLYPKETTPKIKIVSNPALYDPIIKSSPNANMNLSEAANEILLTTPEEFDSFINDCTHLFLINTKVLLEKRKESSEAKRKTKSLPAKDVKNAQGPPRKIHRWI